MNIGIIIGRIGGVDGVALETEKWIEVLDRMGHDVYVLSGRFERRYKVHNPPRIGRTKPKRQTLLPILYFYGPQCRWEQDKAYLAPDGKVELLMEGLEANTNEVHKGIMEWIAENKIDVLMSQNASALPLHLSMGLGIKRAVDDSGLPMIAVNHDFAWERGDRYKTPFSELQDLVDQAFPLQNDSVKHVVINSAAQTELKNRFGLESINIPNVMDFDYPYGVPTIYNSTYLEDLGFSKDDVPLLQVTRVVRRKGIETALHLLDKLDDERYKLVVTGSARDDEGGHYYRELLDLLYELKLTSRVAFASSNMRNANRMMLDNHRVYTLSDAYANGVACLYFSTYEGFGNAFVEAVAAKKPIFVNNYKPVYWPEIGSKGFQTVQLEDNDLTDEAVTEMKRVIDDPTLQQDIAEHNFELGKKYFSYQVLEEHLSTLLDD